MAVGDTVCLKRSDYDPEPPLFGVVDSEPGGTDAVVIWENGRSSQVPQAQLHNVVDSAQIGRVGQGFQIKSFPYGGLPGRPKSGAAWGVCVQAFGLAGYGASPATELYMVIAVEDGRGAMCVKTGAETPIPEGLLLQPDRRLV